MLSPTGYVNNSLHLARKYARMLVRGHYLFREANSFPSELRGTDNVQEQISEHIKQISEHIFALNKGYRVYYPSNLFPTRAVSKRGNI